MELHIDLNDAALLAGMRAGDGSETMVGGLQGYAAGILPNSRPGLKAEDEPQKWVQCAKCSLWRKVPFKLRDEDIPDDWSCERNIWDREHASCSVPQALTDEEIDEILALQEHAVLEAGEVNLADAADLAAFQDAGRPVPLQPVQVAPQARGNGRPRSRNKRSTHVGDDSSGDEDPLDGFTDVDGMSNGNAARINRRRSNPRSMMGSGAAGAGSPMAGRAGRSGSRSRGAGRARGGRIGRGLSQAAEALLGMGVELDGDEVMADVTISEDDDGWHAPVSQFPTGSFRPGRVIWAKVEGHDWWPARVVRRRAVPREVGPPPGGPGRVRTQIPVVFFTAKGIPGEVSDEKQPSTPSGGVEGGEEAEYAWLPIHCLKPFEPQDASKASEDNNGSEDPNLSACIKAAEKVLVDLQAKQNELNDHDMEEDVDSDSDGGWGGPPRQVEMPPTRARGGRGGRGRRGRGRGNRRGGRSTRRGSRGFDNDGSGSESDFPASLAGDAAGMDALGGVGVVPIKLAIEQIYGWRWPAREEESPMKPKAEAEAPKEPVAKPEKYPKADGSEKGLDELMLLSQSRHLSEEPEALAGQPGGPAAQAAPSDRAESAEPAKSEEAMAQEEADAVAALMAAASGDVRSEPEQPPEEEGSPPAETAKEAEFLVKWTGKSHAHNEWVPESTLAKLAKRKLANFKRRHGAAPCCLAEDAWSIPERFMARRPSPAGPGWDVLVKWTNLGHEHATWEAECEGIPLNPDYQHLHNELWARQTAAIERATSAALAAAAEARDSASRHMPEFADSTSREHGAHLHKHQVDAVNELRQRWARGESLLLADDSGLGKSTSFIAFVQSLRTEFRQNGPVLIIAPATSVDNWQSNWEFWGGPEVNVVSYVGSTAARALLHDHELWLTPESLDSKSSFLQKQGLPAKVPKPDVVITSFEALVSDAAALKALSWDFVAVDERTRMLSALSRTYQAVYGIHCRARAIVAHSSLLKTAMVEHVSQACLFLEDAGDLGQALNRDVDDMSMDEQADLAQKLLQQRALARSKEELGMPVRPKREARVPLQLSEAQLECYRDVLARRFDVLADPKRPRHSAQRTSEMRALCAELRKVCNHPYLLHHTRPEEEEECEVVGVSTKWQLMDRLVPLMKEAKQRTLILSQSPKSLDLVEEWATAKWGKSCLERIDNSMPTVKRLETVQRFNEESSEAFLFLLSARACSLGIDLPSITSVIILDSDWDPKADVQALGRAHTLGTLGTSARPLRMLRLFMRNSVEERILMLAERRGGVGAAFRPGSAGGNSASSRGPRLLEEILRWGTTQLFDTSAAAGRDGGLQAQQDGPKQEAGDKPEAMHVDHAGEDKSDGGEANANGGSEPDKPAGAPPPSPMNESAAYSDEALSALVAWEAETEGSGAPEKDSSLSTAGLGLEGVAVRDWSTDEAYSERISGEDEDEEEGTAEDNSEMLPAESTSSAATYWDKLLRHHWQALEKEEGAPNRIEASAQSYGEEGEEGGENGAGAVPLSERGSDELPAGRAQRLPSRRSSELGKRERRKRRLDDADEDDLNSLDEPLEGKKKRRGGHDVVVGGPSGADMRFVKREWARYEAMLGAIGDPTSLEAAVAKRAHKRLAEIAAEVKLSGSGVVELANQAAEVMLMMRDEGQMSSDFQEYTLIALFSLAAHLAGGVAAERASLPAMARYYNQDEDTLNQVYTFIMQELVKYRGMYTSMAELLKSGAPGPDLHAHHDLLASALPQGSSGQGGAGRDGFGPDALSEQHGSDLDVFGRKLAGIIMADYTQLALSAGPLDIAGQIPQLPNPPPDVERNPTLLAEYESIAGQIKSSCHQVALLDRVHNIKVKQIQDEYQSFMEGVRGRAQGAIDQANALFQAYRGDATSQLDAAIHYLQSRFFSFSTPGQAPASGAPDSVGAGPVVADKGGMLPLSDATLSQPSAVSRPENDPLRMAGGNSQPYWPQLMLKQEAPAGSAAPRVAAAAAAAALQQQGAQRSPPFRPPLPPHIRAAASCAPQGNGTTPNAGNAAQASWPFPQFSSGNNLGAAQSFLPQQPAAAPAQQQVVLARQLANQPPSQLPLQRLTSEQMQQLQVQVQQDRLRQAPSAVQSGATVSTGQDGFLQGYMLDNAAANRAAPAAKEEAKAAKEQQSFSGDNNVAQKAPAIITAAPAQANHVSQPNDKGGLAMPAASAAPQASMSKFSPRAPAAGVQPSAQTGLPNGPRQSGQPAAALDHGSVRLDPLGRPMSIDHEHQALLEATAKGSYGARMPRQQQSTLGPASMARPGGHLPPDARARGHMLGSQHVRPILTGLRGSTGVRPEVASPSSERSQVSATAPRSFGAAQPGAAAPEARPREAAWPAPATIDAWKKPAAPAVMPAHQHHHHPQQQQQQAHAAPVAAAAEAIAVPVAVPGPHSAGSRSPSPAQQSERLLQPVTAVTAHPVKAVVQTGERPDFERTTSSGAPARPGPITSGMPKPRLDFRVPSGSFLDAGGLVNDSQDYQRGGPQRKPSSPGNVKVELAAASVPHPAVTQCPGQAEATSWSRPGGAAPEQASVPHQQATTPALAASVQEEAKGQPAFTAPPNQRVQVEPVRSQPNSAPAAQQVPQQQDQVQQQVDPQQQQQQ